MELVINRQYGGFDLSHKAVMRYAELKGITLFPWIGEISKKAYGDKATIDNPTVPKHYTTVSLEEYERVTQNDKEKGNYTESNKLYFSDRDISRNDAILIQVVKELGKEADGQCATLEIIEIPDRIDWEIEEHDGVEWVAEEHRTWK